MAGEVSSIAVGRVLRPWGRDGAVVVEPWTHDPGRFDRLVRVEARAPGDSRWLEIESHRVDPGGRPIVRFRGIESIDQAETLRGRELRVEEALAERPGAPGEMVWFQHELVGLEVRDATGCSLGVVREILETGAAPVLVVRDELRSWLLPLAAEFLRSVDVSARVMVVAPPEGLLEVNEREVADAV